MERFTMGIWNKAIDTDTMPAMAKTEAAQPLVDCSRYQDKPREMMNGSAMESDCHC